LAFLLRQKEINMLFSIFSTYYDKSIFKEFTDQSILEQNYDNYEYLPIDNSDNRYLSAGHAYNDKAFDANGEYLIFMHQDVKLYSQAWLATLAELVNSYQFGIAGCSGVSDSGQRLGFIKDRKTIWGRPFCTPQDAQTVDESIMIIPKNVFVSLRGFDPTLGWNTYGADFSLKCLAQKMKVMVFPLFLWHNSPSVLRGVEKVLWQLQQRYGQYVHTTSGSTRSKSLIINSLKSYFPPALKKYLVLLLSRMGMEKEGNVLSFKLRKAKKVLMLDVLPEGCEANRLIIPEKIKLEGLSNNPVWRDLSIDLIIVQEMRELEAYLPSICSTLSSAATLVPNGLKPYFMQYNDIQIVPFSVNYSLLRGRGV